MKDNILYLECYSGISGDMVVASLIDLGVDLKYLKEALESVPIYGYTIKISKVKKNGVEACDFNVIIDEGHHVHRNLNDVFMIIKESKITLNAKKLAMKIFYIEAEAEAKAQGVEIEQVNFDEFGVVELIIYIVAVAVCLDYLNINDAVISEIYEGKGHVECQEGFVPIPVPAVTNMVLKYKMPIKITSNDGEMITATGMAIASAIKTKEALPESYVIKAIGVGAGKKDYNNSNILRAYLIQEAERQQVEKILSLEINIDDCSGETIGYTMKKFIFNI
ncbi:MAG: LarC family nickel insertion protein [Clostridium sp.]|uniref:LarC family nickel insertion protein n=1 Tax=Clostridium sp. TaxID=1506 RepID=UPI001D46A368|nr:LarC family nickel insertion protein [Clostridium sp.]MBS5124599.1 LarC family nickel insertion protein [Clostridium sp.]